MKVNAGIKVKPPKLLENGPPASLVEHPPKDILVDFFRKSCSHMTDSMLETLIDELQKSPGVINFPLTYRRALEIRNSTYTLLAFVEAVGAKFKKDAAVDSMWTTLAERFPLHGTKLALSAFYGEMRGRRRDLKNCPQLQAWAEDALKWEKTHTQKTSATTTSTSSAPAPPTPLYKNVIWSDYPAYETMHNERGEEVQAAYQVSHPLPFAVI